MRQVAPDDADQRIRKRTANVGRDGHAGEQGDELLEQQLTIVQSAAGETRHEKVGGLTEELDIGDDPASVELIDQGLKRLDRRAGYRRSLLLCLLERHLRLLACVGRRETSGLGGLLHLVLDVGLDL